MLPIREERLAKLDPFALPDLHHRPGDRHIEPQSRQPWKHWRSNDLR